MTWALREPIGEGRLMEFEAKLNHLLPKNPIIETCQYDRRRFGSWLLQDVMATHPLSVIGTEVFDNFHYL